MACLVYEMLMGEPPYNAYAAAHRNPDQFPGKPEVLSEAAWEVLKSGLAYRKEDRPDSAEELVQRLEAAQAAPEPIPVEEAETVASTPEQTAIGEPETHKPEEEQPLQPVTEPKPEGISTSVSTWHMGKTSILTGLLAFLVIGGTGVYVLWLKLDSRPAIETPIVEVPDQPEKPEKPSVPSQTPEPVIEQSSKPVSVKPDFPPIEDIHGWPAEKVKDLQSQAAAALGMKTEFQDRLKDGSLGPEMVVIPAGEFLMGSPEDEEGRDDDETLHTVRIEKPFAIGKYEVTVGQFRLFAEAKGFRTEAEKGDGCWYWDGKEWKKDAEKTWRNPGFEQGDDHPITCVSWNDAVAYTKWLQLDRTA